MSEGNGQEERRAGRVEIVSRPKAITEHLSVWVPLFVSILALGTSVSSAYQTRLHNRLSVMPYLYIRPELSSDLVLRLVNDGVGPAIIQEAKLEFNKKPATWDMIIQQNVNLFKPGFSFGQYNIFERGALRNDTMLGTGGKVDLLTIPSASMKDPASGPVFSRNLLDGITVFIKYCSIYRDCKNLKYDRHSEQPSGQL